MMKFSAFLDILTLNVYQIIMHKLNNNQLLYMWCMLLKG